jgi:hypothetical protein
MINDKMPPEFLDTDDPVWYDIFMLKNKNQVIDLFLQK